jgi:hypothetical protein
VRGAVGLRAALLAVVAAASGGCGDARPDIVIQVGGFWNDNPSTVAETGYRLGVDVGYPDRHEGCFSLSPNLRVQVNELEATPTFVSDCQWDSLTYLGPFDQNGTFTVRWLDGDRVLGEAEFTNLIPGADARLVTPSAGTQVKVGDPVAVTLPLPPVSPTAVYAEFYWLDMPPAAPPFHTFVNGTLSDDKTVFQVAAPAVIGRAAVVLKTVYTPDDLPTVRSCTGFLDCFALPDHETVGPVYVDVVP